MHPDGTMQVTMQVRVDTARSVLFYYHAFQNLRALRQAQGPQIP